jgi:2-polyprenyl-3-methyl-5-hydroxy-6-metoxy-1,4-benzoquinol methylase/uncharacterized protein YbaR (Trm112 family)
LDRAVLDYLRCPRCRSGEWTLEAAEVQTLTYNDGAREEVRTGSLTCAAGHAFPIERFVLSLESTFPADLRQEANYWTGYYLWNLNYAGKGLHDLKQGFAPFAANGVPEPFPFADTVDRYDVHYWVAEHPLLRAGKTLLDMGVGLGWTSIHFARSGYSVTAFDPSLGTIQAAKAYAISQGLFIEYLCAAVGYVQFRDDSFDNITAFHSLHHVPDLEYRVEDLRRWLRPGGALAVDEHIASSRLAGGIGAQIHQWAEEEVFPRYRSLSPEVMAELPAEPHSALEDAGMTQVVSMLRRTFRIQHEKPRHVFLDHFPLLYYLSKDRGRAAYLHSLEIANRFQEFVRAADPDGGEYITLIAVNEPPAPEPEQQTSVASAQVEPAHEPPAPTPDANTSSDTIEHLKVEVDEVRQAMREQGEWARSLEAAVQERDREIARLSTQLRKIENGRVMRLLNKLGGRATPRHSQKRRG